MKSMAFAEDIFELFDKTELSYIRRQEIISLAFRGFHRYEIARHVSVSSFYLEMIISSVKGLVKWRRRCKHESKRRRYKCILLRYLRLYPERIRKDIKRDCNAAFYWLYKHEHERLESILPNLCPPSFELVD